MEKLRIILTILAVGLLAFSFFTGGGVNMGLFGSQRPTLEMVNEMGSSDDLVRTNAVEKLVGSLRGRPNASRQPELVDPLTELFNTSTDPEVRSVCVQALTELAEDGEAPSPLFDALSDTDPAVVVSGIFALTYFPNNQALEPLCEFIQSRKYDLYSESAVSHLGEMGDPKAVPILAAILMDANNKLDQGFATTAIALSRCGQEGFDALVSALNHEDPRIRLAAVVGLDVSGNKEANIYLDRALDDPDPNVQQRAKVRVGKLRM